MSESIGTAWALGSIAGSLSAESNARASDALMRAFRRRLEPEVQVDVNALNELIQRQQEYIGMLEAENAELRRQGTIVAANRDEIHRWAKIAGQKLRDHGIT